MGLFSLRFSLSLAPFCLRSSLHRRSKSSCQHQPVNYRMVSPIRYPNSRSVSIYLWALHPHLASALIMSDAPACRRERQSSCCERHFCALTSWSTVNHLVFRSRCFTCLSGPQDFWSSSLSRQACCSVLAHPFAPLKGYVQDYSDNINQRHQSERWV